MARGAGGGCPWSPDGKHQKSTRGCGCPRDPDRGQGGGASFGRPRAAKGEVLVKAHAFKAQAPSREYFDNRARKVRVWACSVCGREVTLVSDWRVPEERCPEIRQ